MITRGQGNCIQSRPKTLLADLLPKLGQCRSGLSAKSLNDFGDPNGTRTRVFAVKGRRPGPLDDGAAVKARALGEPSGGVKQVLHPQDAFRPHCRHSTRHA